ncbi:MAG: response regulator [Ferruginibacter sp.]
MPKHPIIIIEDDEDDFRFLQDVIEELKVPEPVLWFRSCMEALDYLSKTDDTVFLIFSDINLPRMSGMKMRRLIDEDERLRKKSIPFVFYTTSANKKEVDEAYDMIVQGFFTKESDPAAIKETVDVIIRYWRRCLHPNKM